MKDFSVLRGGGLCDIRISGKDLVDAVERNFDAIAKIAGIGNAAGYTLDKVWMEWQNEYVHLHITAHGSDNLVQYDPRKDAPEECVVRIRASEQDCSARYDFDLTEPDTKDFDFFGPDAEVTPAAMFGVALGLMDWVAENRCVRKEVYLSSFVDGTMSRHHPDRMLLLVLSRLQTLRPKRNAETDGIMDRAADLIGKFCKSEVHNVGGEYLTYYYKTLSATSRKNKITALEKLRKKAGLTQQQLADTVGISVRQLIRYENARQSSLGDANKAIIKGLAEAIGASPKDLVNNGVIMVES